MTDTSSKTEKPTPKRRKEARQKGQIPKSQEITTWASVLALAVLLKSALVNAGRALTDVMDEMSEVASRPDPATALAYFVDSLVKVSLAVAPALGGTMVVLIVATVAQTGITWSSKKLKPSFKMLNPLQGIKRVFGSQGLAEAVKATIKLTVLGVIGYRTLTGFVPEIIGHGTRDLPGVMTYSGETALRFVRDIAVVSLVLAAADYGYNRRKIMKGLRMSKQEILEEHKQSDGDPMMKGKRRSMQMALSRNRMMAAVATADAVIVNPTHIAVAIKYTPGTGAPRVIAKGMGAVAERIRDEAEKNSVPLIQDIPLARTLYKVCDLDAAVPAMLFEAVAKVLAFVFALRATGRLSYGGIHRMPTETVSLRTPEQLAELRAKRRTLTALPA